MRKVLIISFYELKDYLLHISNLFADNYGYDVDYYPLFMYKYDKNSKIENYEEHFSKFCSNYNPDIILWWFTDVPIKVFKRIRNENKKTYFIIYNFDDPLNISKSYLDKCSYFDLILTPSKHNFDLYKLYSNCNTIKFCPFGFENIDYNIKSNYSCDISFICDQLYDPKLGINAIIPRRELIKRLEKLSEKNNISFHLYGPEILKIFFPKHYKGDPDYLQLNEIYTNSKINIQSHPFSNKKLSINSKIMQIMNYGVLLVDECNDFNFFGDTVFFYNNENLEEKIMNILNYDLSDIKLKSKKFSEKYSWNNIIKNIFIEYNKFKFDEYYYKKNYNNINIKNNNNKITFNDWLSKFEKNIIEIPYKFEIPNNFNIDFYKEKFQLENYSNEYCFIHWNNNGKDINFMKKNNNQSLISGEEFNTITPNLFYAYTSFNQIFYKRNIDTGLNELKIFSNSNPRVKINDILSNYINMTFS